MPRLNEQDHADRALRIYASDLEPVLCGQDQYGRTAGDVWARLTGKLLPATDEVTNEAAELGHKLEPVVLDMMEGELGPIIRDPLQLHFIHPSLPLGAHLDGLTADHQVPAEAKTTGQAGPVPAEWLEAIEKNEVPERVLLQVHAQMLCAGSDLAFVGALIGTRGYFLFHVPLNKDLANLVAHGVQQFWDLYVRTDTPPPDSTMSLDVLKRFRRVTGKVVEVNWETYEGWTLARYDRLNAEKKEEGAKAQLITQLGDAEIGIALGTGALSFSEQTAMRFSLTDFRREHPDIAKLFLQESKFRKLGTPIKFDGKRYKEIEAQYQSQIGHEERKEIEDNGNPV